MTGAAGALGQRVVAALAQRSDVGRVVAIDIAAGPSGEVIDGPSGDGVVARHRVDLAAPAPDPDPVVGLAREADGVIHLAWITGDGRGSSPPGEANLRALRRVLGAVRAPTLVHLSSATVYGAWADNPVPLTEDLPIRPNPELGFAVEKAEAERVVAEWSSEHPATAVSVLRPCVVVGAPKRPLYQALGGTRTPRGEDGARPVQFLHVDDLARAVLVAWDRRLSGTFNVAPDAGTREDTARALAGGLARVPLPWRLGSAVGHLGWLLWRSGSPRQARAYGRHPWVVAADRLMAAGWVPQYSSEEALVATDDRSHWDDLPPGRRQEFTLLVAAGAVVAVVAATFGAVLAVRRRRRPRGVLAVRRRRQARG